MNEPWRTMVYDRERGCWVVQLNGGTYTVHCGECFHIRIDDRHGFTCRLELDRDWYVIMGESRFNLKKKEVYQIRFDD